MLAHGESQAENEAHLRASVANWEIRQWRVVSSSAHRLELICRSQIRRASSRLPMMSAAEDTEEVFFFILPSAKSRIAHLRVEWKV